LQIRLTILDMPALLLPGQLTFRNSDTIGPVCGRKATGYAGAPSGVVRLMVGAAPSAYGCIRASSRRRDAGHLAPGVESGVPGGAVLVGGQAVATELEVVVDAGVGGEEAPGVPRRFEPLHLSFQSPRRLVRHLDQVIQVALAPSRGAISAAADFQQDALPDPEKALLQLHHSCRQTG